MPDAATSSIPSAPPWRGVHHIALVTTNLDDTREFYGTILGMQPGDILPPNPLHGRHCLIPLDAAATSFLHFFEQPGAALHPYPLDRGLVFPRELGALHHLSLALPDEAAGLALHAALAARGIGLTPVMDQGPVRNVLFLDNNGILLEAAWPGTTE